MLFSSIVIVGQEEKVLATQYGIKISYQLVLEDEGNRKDDYILIVHATNTSENNLYYAVPIIEDEQAAAIASLMSGSTGFTKIKVRNSTGWFGDGKSLSGDKTNFVTTDKNNLYEIKKGSIYTQETSFKVKSGKKPIVTNSFIMPLQKLSDFDLEISNEMLEGQYISSCGNMSVTISAKTDAVKGDYLVQTTNSKEFIWIKTDGANYKRENNEDISLIFNKENESFIYSTADGISCTWNKQ